MTEADEDEFFLIFRPDFDDPETMEGGPLLLHVLASSPRGETVRQFMIQPERVVRVPGPDPKNRVIKIFGTGPTGELVCTLTYNDYSFTQTLRVEPPASPAAPTG